MTTNRYFKPTFDAFDSGYIVKLPVRSTKGSAGYDFFVHKDITIPSIWKVIFKSFIKSILNLSFKPTFKPTLIPTFVKAHMCKNEVLMLYNRSSNPSKLGLVMANGVGVIDSDYYSNKDNDGNIGGLFYNLFPWDIKLKRGDKAFQGVFQLYLQVDDDNADNDRVGGFGSTGV